MNPLAPFLAYIARKRAERQVKAAERKRAAIMAHIADRKAHRREHRPMHGLLREATNASLRASLGRR